ncbi:MAG TPA: hypothetical protein VGO80_08520 [Solirubrobacteraceae bacterium]|nr:hypothetical protein [Solirubrobacteraceae bacterium]
MSDDEDLANQVERGALFTHSALSGHAERINRIEAFLYGVVDALLDAGHVTEEQLRDRAAAVGDELREQGETLSGGVALRVDADPPAPDATVDCAARLPVCKAVCCKLSFALSAQEVEAGRVKWDLGKPYLARKDHAGSCVHLTDCHSCGVYDDRPRVCHSYSCAGDERIWTDFEGMVINQEWIDANLGPDQPHLAAVQMRRVE